jgi:phage terminase large subunit-like protein
VSDSYPLDLAVRVILGSLVVGSWNLVLLAAVSIQRGFSLLGRGRRNVAAYSIHESDRSVYGESNERAQLIRAVLGVDR